MKFISHRGNINGKNLFLENKPEYIDLSISNYYDVEVDLWYKDKKLWLGHDLPTHLIDINWIKDRKAKLWIHCKNINALYFLKTKKIDKLNFFWHQNDDVTITSLGYFWTYPSKQLTKNSIAVLPEIKNFKNIKISYGICSDFIQNYKKL